MNPRVVNTIAQHGGFVILGPYPLDILSYIKAPKGWIIDTWLSERVELPCMVLISKNGSAAARRELGITPEVPE